MSKLTLDWNKYTDAAVKIAEEGIVMLKNDSALPFSKGTRVALFGRMQNNYYKSGTGSGGMVNVNHVVDIPEALSEKEKNGFLTLDKNLIEVYREWEKENPVDPGIGWGQERWSQEEMVISEDDVKVFASENDAAVIVIARTAGEDRDNTATKGSFYLTDEEEIMLDRVCSSFSKTVVLLNVGNIIDMSWVQKYNPSAVLYIWQCGMTGGMGVANIITGEATPSGGLTDTIAYRLEDYPAYENYAFDGDGTDGSRDFYREDIFVGYRYFSTFAPEKVMYPFGFGLSYTDFAVETEKFTKDGDVITVMVKVTNTGKFSGKKRVLVFADLPEGNISKPKRVLAAFTKTSELKPGESAEVSMEFNIKRIASYDDEAEVSGWYLEKGTYAFAVGDDVNAEIPAGSFELSEDTLLEELSQALAPVEKFDRLSHKNGQKTYEPVPLRKTDNLDTRLDKVMPEIPQTGDRGIKLSDVKNGKASIEEFTAQLSDEDLSLIIRGEGMSSPKATTGTAAAFGGISRELKEYGIPTLCCSDGPSGMRIDSGKKAFSIPNGTCIASTFNRELTEELFYWFGIEMRTNCIDTILGPGINIHRYPLNGRNFEYFSEDPVLTGLMASSQITALEKNSVTATIKHFCCNNREYRRRFMDSVVSEKALREIYLKPFEIAVKAGHARSIMTVYNMINGTYGSQNYELNTAILRNQWHYTGIVMTDWWAFIIPGMDFRDRYALRDHSLMARAQNDIYMVCSNVERECLTESDTFDCIKDGRTDRITRAELQRNAMNIIRFAMNTPAMERLLGTAPEIDNIDNPFADDAIEAVADVYYNISEHPVIEIEGAGGEDGKDFVLGFIINEPGRYSYKITAESSLSNLAQIPMTIYYTSIPVRVITWQGTEGQEDTRESDIRLASKNSIVRFHFGGAGLRIKRIEFKLKCRLQDDESMTI